MDFLYEEHLSACFRCEKSYLSSMVYSFKVSFVLISCIFSMPSPSGIQVGSSLSRWHTAVYWRQVINEFYFELSIFLLKFFLFCAVLPFCLMNLSYISWIILYTHSAFVSGATNPDYIVTADDVDKLIAVECIPMDEQGRQVI